MWVLAFALLLPLSLLGLLMVMERVERAVQTPMPPPQPRPPAAEPAPVRPVWQLAVRSWQIRPRPVEPADV
jgi:hypothetical protein